MSVIAEKYNFVITYIVSVNPSSWQKKKKKVFHDTKKKTTSPSNYDVRFNKCCIFRFVLCIHELWLFLTLKHIDIHLEHIHNHINM